MQGVLKDLVMKYGEKLIGAEFTFIEKFNLAPDCKGWLRVNKVALLDANLSVHGVRGRAGLGGYLLTADPVNQDSGRIDIGISNTSREVIFRNFIIDNYPGHILRQRLNQKFGMPMEVK